MTRAASVSPPERTRYAPLRVSRDFSRVFRLGHRTRKGGVVVVRAEGQTGTARVGWVVRKGLGHAVARNRIKRRLRHAASEVPWPEGYDYVVIASPAVLDTEFRTVVRWLREAVEMEA